MSVETFRGHFWDPADPDNRLPGFLEIGDDGSITLELIGGFATSRWEPQPSPSPGVSSSVSVEVDPPSFVLGVADNQQFTLIDCTVRASTRFGMGASLDFDRQTIGVGRCLRRVHLVAKDDEAFYGVQVDIEYLPFWATRSGIQLGYKTQGDKVLPGSTAEQLPVDPVSVAWRDLTVSLRVFNSRFSFERDATTTRVHSIERVVIQLESETPRSLDYWAEYMKKMQDLVTLGVGQPCGVASIVLRTTGGDDPWRIQEYGKRAYMAGDDPYRDPSRKLLLTCHHVPFEELVPRWLDLEERALRAISILTGMHYSSSDYLETSLVTVCIALEVLHRSLYDHPPMTEAEFGAIRDAALAGMSGAAKRWVNSRLHNSLSYKERAQELAAKPDQEAVATLLGDAGKWAKLVREARNGTAHEGVGRDLSFELSYRLLEVTRRLLELVLMAELGVSAEQQREVVGSASSIGFHSREFKRLAGAASLAQIA